MPKAYLRDEDRQEAARKKRYALLGRRIRRYIADENINQKQFAERAHVCKSTICDLANEKANSNPTLEMLVRIVKTAKMPPEEWLEIGGFKS